jgi:hypothetical protein
MKDYTIDNKGKDGKSKPLRFTDDGKLIIQYSKEEKQTTTITNTNYRYYEDLYGNQYRWTTHKQSDGKFHARILKLKRQSKYYQQLRTTKSRAFAKKKSAITWCLKAYLKAKQRQEQVIKARGDRKKARDDLKPKGKQLSLLKVESNLKHYKQLKKKNETKIKSLNTRIKFYGKKIKYYEKRKEILK